LATFSLEMKHFALSLLFLIIAFPLAAQIVDKGTVLIGAEAGIGLYNSTQNFTATRKPTGETTGFPHFQIRADIGVKKGFALGLTVRSNGTISENSTDTVDQSTENFKISSGAILLNASYYLVNKDKSGLFAGVSVGGTSLTADGSQIDTLEQVETATVSATAITVLFQGGYHKLLSRKIGLNLKASYASMPFGFDSFQRNGVEQERLGNVQVKQAVLNLRGIEIEAGLTFHF